MREAHSAIVSSWALCEVVVPGPNQPSFAKYLDLEMLVHAGGKERTEREYAALFATAGLRPGARHSDRRADVGD